MMKALAISGSLVVCAWLSPASAQSSSEEGPASPSSAPAAFPAEAPAASPAEAPAAPDAEAPPAPPPPATEPPRARVQWVSPGQAPPRPSEIEEQAPVAADEPWSLQGSHLVVAVERITSAHGWSEEVAGSTANLFYPSGKTTLETTGADVNLLGAGGAVRSPSSVPRLAFDAVLSGGFTIGGALSYMHSSGESQAHDANADATSPPVKLPDQSIFIFASRAGGLIRASSNLGIWLRGGFTRTSVVRTGAYVGADSSGGVVEIDQTASLWNLSLDPQLLMVAAPHVAISLAGLFDIGLPGTLETRGHGVYSDSTSDIKASAYGVSAGIAAIF